MHTRQLHDEGEEHWPLKLHLGNGGIYLVDSGTGYVNCDIEGRLATDCPNLIAANTTTISDYYAGLDGDMDHLPAHRETIVDRLLDAKCLPYEFGTVDKIVAVQMFEHLSPIGAFEAMQNWSAVLRKNGVLIISVPDMSLTLSLIATDPLFAMRHIQGRMGEKYHSHKAWYTWATLTEFLYWGGFSVDPLDNFHFYPALCVRAIKL